MIKTSPIAAAAAPSFTGKGKAMRAAAFASISHLAYSEALSRAASVNNMRVVLGATPSAAEIDAARLQWIVGRVAFRLPASKVPMVSTEAQRLARASDLVLRYAAPAKEGAQARKLRLGQIGRRTAAEQKLVHSAKEACSLFFAELGLTNAQTIKQRDAGRAAKKTVAPSMAGSGKGKKAAAPSHAELVKPAAPLTPADYVQHMQTQLSALLAFDNKHAKLRPVTHGAFAEGLAALKQTANKAANDFAEREAAAKK
jgi:hypothetical protein